MKQHDSAKKPLSRLIIIGGILFVMMATLILQLFRLTIAQGESFAEEAVSRANRTVVTKGKRGQILDRNGLVLAYDEACFNVEFNRNPNKRTNYDRAVYTEAIIKAIKIIEEGGCSVIDTSYICRAEDGSIYYDFGVTSETFVKARYRNFCNVMGFNMPDEDDMSTWITAQDAYIRLRKLWYIPEELSFEEARKVISIWQEVLLNNYRSYMPVTIAYNVTLDVVAKIEMMADELPGLQTSQSTMRYYPYGQLAAHIVGYCQKMSAENAEELLQKGYAYDDYIGVSGVEATMEEFLTGATKEHHGTISFEVNSNGAIINTISSTPATDGSNVTLTIDMPMQTVAAQALYDIIQAIHEKELAKIYPNGDGVPAEQYAEYEAKNGTIELAETGAIVVMSVNTGEVLALASYPSYDPNWFIQGLTDEQAEYLYGDPDVDGDFADRTTPARNKAISMKLAPGSIFKMCTGLAGLMEGVVGLEETISDESPYIYFDEETGKEVDTKAKCWTSNPAKHHDQDIIKAVTNSCNYYFYEVSFRLGIDRLVSWAEKLGFTSKTGIELTGETKGIVGGQKSMYDNTRVYNDQDTSIPLLVYRQLCRLLKNYQTMRGVEIIEDDISACAEELMELQDGSLKGKGSEVRQILSNHLGIPDGISRAQSWDSEITSLLNELQWKASLTIRTGIGQGILLVTPIEAVRYVAAIANGGTVYDAHIVSSVTAPDGETLLQTEPTIFNKIEAPDSYWEALRQGMKGVVSPEDGGTAGTAFSKEYNEMGYLDRTSGKTGSAQVGGVTIDIQNTSWFVAFAPNDDPDIAIVVCVPNGLSGSSSAGAVEEILTYYFTKLNSKASETLAGVDELTP
jgi:penicillin-binding protein 2